MVCATAPRPLKLRSQMKRRILSTQPPALPNISRASTIKVFGVYYLERIVFSDHVISIIRDCSQSL